MEEALGIGSFGASLRVENVQALAARLDHSKAIPERYVRPEREEEKLKVAVAGAGDSIPVIDFARLLDPLFAREESARLHSACQDWGFFQLINHGIDEDVIKKMVGALEEFFKLPLEEKEKVGQVEGQIEGYGQAFVQSEDQKLDWGDMLFIGTSPPQRKNLRFWPINPPSFRDSTEKYAEEVKKVADFLAGVMSENLGLGRELYDLFKNGIQSFRFNYYPPCPSADKVLGLSPHSDGVGFTLLLQVNGRPGLQIRRDGRWLAVEPLQGALVINIGDIVEILCNGRYKSIEHRAVISSEWERMSVAAFHLLDVGQVVGPIPQIARREKVLYKSLLFEEYAKMFFKSKLKGKSKLDQMKLE
ncbi:S-norcoclaurine synthase 1 [Apostasia shenzhenica]|uniref:S-norcoclaurine synthase 1 n=1 Tax=Apostasia shenzhenica TaxID=1088818 RepID=A0A2I0AWY5_9ASPA|nr:S-norcoclaurine synthase 1 [Apostasia shenzhenica]